MQPSPETFLPPAKRPLMPVYVLLWNVTLSTTSEVGGRVKGFPRSSACETSRHAAHAHDLPANTPCPEETRRWGLLLRAVATLSPILTPSRWIKFEEKVEEGGERWSKPHVSTLSLHSLFELRTCLQTGTVLLDLDSGSLPQIIGEAGTSRPLKALAASCPRRVCVTPAGFCRDQALGLTLPRQRHSDFQVSVPCRALTGRTPSSKSPSSKGAKGRGAS